jgi:hypothetical protein
MARYFWKDGQFVDRDGIPMEKPFAGQIVMPTVLSDIPEYRSPIDGRPITSRSARREDLKRNGCVEYEPSMKPKHPKFEAFEERRKRTLKENRL